METTTPPPDKAVAAVPMGRHGKAQAGNQALLIIGLFKLGKAALVFAAAFGLLRMVNRDTEVEIKKIIHVLRIQDDSKMAKAILLKANVIDDPHKKIIGGLLVFYGLLFSTEGIGLIMRQRWAEYFTIILTATGIPIELYEIFHRTSHPGKIGDIVPVEQRHLFIFDRLMVLKILALVVNAAILWFLIAYVRRNGPHGHKSLPESQGDEDA